MNNGNKAGILNVGARFIAPIFASLSLSACITAPHVEDYKATLPEELTEAETSNGSIYQANHDVALFENPVAHRVGDIVTIRLVEETAASKSSSTSTKKATNVNAGVSNLFGRAVTVNGTNVLGAGVKDSSDFAGEGNSEQSNKLAGDITVTIAKRYSNGNLLVRGQKWIAINQGKEFVRIQGIIRQVDVQPDNSVLSTKVADATISYGGQGALADANAKGWLARFFDSPLTPF
jgi:flagellar L-ring protein precursor FlgH